MAEMLLLMNSDDDYHHLIPDTGISLRALCECLDECGTREWREFRAESNGQQQREGNDNSRSSSTFDGQCRVSALSAVGYLSRIWRLCFSSVDGRRHFKAVIKCPNPEYVARINLIDAGSSKHEFDSFISALVQFHHREVFFYTEFYDKFIVGTDFAGFLPRAFAWRDCSDVQELGRAFIVLEDLSERTTPPTDPNNLNKEQIEATIRAIALLHARSLASSSPHKWPIDALKSPHQNRYRPEQIVQKLCAPENACAEYFQANQAKLHEFLDSVAQDENCNDGICAEFGIQPVFTHGDLWANNLLFDRNNPNKLVAILDWQFAQSGSGMNDLARLLACSVSVAILHAHLHEWITMYCREMRTAINNKMDSGNGSGRERIAANVEEARVEGILARHLRAMLHFEMQMLLLNEEVGETGERLKHRQEHIQQLFDMLVVRKTNESAH